MELNVRYGFPPPVSRIISMGSAKQRMAGKKDQAVGSTKKVAGRVTGDRDLEARGAAQQGGGKVREKVGQIQRVFEK